MRPFISVLKELITALDPVLRSLGIPSETASRHLASMLHEARPRRSKRTDAATVASIRTLDDLIAGLRSLVRDEDSIRWNHPQVRRRWIEAWKLVRALDISLAVPVHSFYATDPETVRYLLDREEFSGDVWEPCSGDGAIVREVQARGHSVHASDLRDHPDVVGQRGVDVFDLTYARNVITNPPYWNALDIVEHLISITTGKIAILLRIEFLGSQSRRRFFRDHPPARIYTVPDRPKFADGGDPDRKKTTRWEYGWYIWERGYGGETRVIH